MTYQSTLDLRVLHAVRLLGFATSQALAERSITSQHETLTFLLKAESAGWIQHFAFADLEGWSLTDSGKTENERQLMAELVNADPEGVVAAVYREFLPLNARLLRAVTDWQIKPTLADRFAPNDHTVPAWDEGILRELAALGEALSPLTKRLTGVLARYNNYAARFESALHNAQEGQVQWIDKTDVDSCHRVWFELHEDLVATLGIERGREV